MESKTKTCKLKIAFRLRTSPTRLSPICMKRPLRSLDGRRRAYRANAHQTAQKARSGKISRWENLCQPPWEAPRPPTACALPNFPKSERWKVHINSYPCSGMYRESEIHLLVSNFWNQENQRRQHTHTNSEECLTTQCHVLLWDQKCRLNRGSPAQMPLFLWNVACNKHLLPPSQEIGYNCLMISEWDEKIIDIFSWIPLSNHMVSSGSSSNSLISKPRIAFFHDYLNKTFDILKNMMFISKNPENFIFATPSEGSGFF